MKDCCKSNKKEEVVMKNKIDWYGIINLILYGSIFALLFLGFPQKVCSINLLPLNCVYGQWASYFIMGILFWVLFKDINFFYYEEKKKE